MKRSDGIKNTGPDTVQGHTPQDETASSLIDGDIETGLTGEGNMPGDTDTAAEGGSDSIAAESETEMPPRKPNLSREQQLWLNKVFIPNFRKELMKNIKAGQLLSESEKKKLVDLRSKAKRDKNAADSGLESLRSAAVEEVKKASEEERERLLGTIREIKVDRELVIAASKRNAVNPGQVAKLLRDSVRLDEDLNPTILDEAGELAVNAEGKLMSIDERVRLFMDGNPHMVKPSGSSSGSGARNSIHQPMSITPITGGDLISEGLREEGQSSHNGTAHGNRPWD